MIEWHKFHFKIDKELLDVLDKACIKMCISSREGIINYIFSYMMPLLEDIESMEDFVPFEDNSSDFKHDLIINLRPDNFSRLRYFHFRFKTFSMATILRKVLRLYLIIWDKVIKTIICELIKVHSKRSGYSGNFKIHMNPINDKKERTLTLDSNCNLKNLTVFT